MSYKTITVCLDNSVNAIKLVRFSIDLALQYDAHITGLFISYISPFVYDCCGQMTALMMELRESQVKNVKEAEESFTSMAKLTGVNYDWLDYSTRELNNIAAGARTSDLVIINQYNPDDVNTSQDSHFIGRLVLQLGRPLLILPESEKLPESFDRILIAWDGGREAARAMADALPFLQKAKFVKVLTVNKLKSANVLPNLGIGEYLARHDIKAEISEEDSLLADPADYLFTKVNDFNADLLVMGAYGHDWVSELIFGGMTQKFLGKSNVSVLMSH